MVKIRLARGGANKRPFYYIVIADERSPRDGRSIERVGFYNPIATGKEVPLSVELDRVKHWIGVGAQPTLKVRQLIKIAQSQQPAAA
jgi:small subunit ribosomal protein S16